MIPRRSFLFSSLAATSLRAAPLDSRQRVERALAGKDVDRPPFTFWYHFGLEKQPGDRHAKATLDFHRRLRTDLVKVMSDFPYPKGSGGAWHQLKPVDNPFPEQLKALEIIRTGLGGRAHYIETIFNPWNVAEKLSSPAEVRRLMAEKPQALLDALEAIAKSEAAHARKAVAGGASGVFLAVANAQDGVMTRQEYAKFSQPFDRMVLDAVRSAPLNVLHLHGDKVRMDVFYKGWPAAAINYSMHGTGVPVAEARRNFPGVLMAGLDERNFRQLTAEEMKRQWTAARSAAGARYMAVPGCSVPNETTDAELLRLVGTFA